VLETAGHASPEWLATWGRCEPGRDLAAHATTVFARLRGRAVFARLGELAVGIAVASEGLVGLFCLAVDPAHRRVGLGTALVERLLARWPECVAYLKVEEANTVALSVYDRLGFTELYRYRHRVAG
jgi:ribosomal protein S18 acetylase RimI-like enzyme